MLRIDEIISDDKILYHNRLEEFYPWDQVLMFDIETTGLSPANTKIYLIGINYKDSDGWHITQFFNQDGRSEAEILKIFLSFLSGRRYLLHFNGDTFDIPFVKKRIEILNRMYDAGIPEFPAEIQSIDLYKMIRPYKTLFGLPNLKQKTIEKSFGLNRIDLYNGGELIGIYKQFLVFQGEHEKSLLLQHNRDDMEGMYYLSSILAVPALMEGGFEIAELSCDTDKSGTLFLNMQIFLRHPLLFPLTFSYEGVRINLYNSSGVLSVPVLSGELKYFFPDHKNYDYYPELDEAYHKSLAKTMSEPFEKATKENCYTRRYGHFIPQFNLNLREGFRLSAKDSVSYIEIDDKFLGDPSSLQVYAKNLIRFLAARK